MLQHCCTQVQQLFFRKASVLLVCTVLLANFEVQAQDPPQYGTPFAGVPDRMDANIYQLNLREFSSTRNIEGARQKLQHIKNLGINVIYLMPHYPLGVLNNPDGSPYSHCDLKSVAVDLGTLTNLRQFVDEAHANGMAVILDWVANQTSWDHPWITQHPDWYVRDSGGNILPPCPAPGYCFNDVAHLDLNVPGARAAMIDAMRYWIFAANVDGYRFDWADKAPQNFWIEALANLRSITSHKLLFLAEGSNEGTTSGCSTCGENQPGYHYQSGFDYIFGTNFYWNVMKKVWNAGEPANNLNGVTTGEYFGASSTQLVARFLSNHDDYNAEGSPFSFLSGGRNAAMSAFVVIAYHRGVPFVYNGLEVGNTNPLPYPWNSGTINWTQDLTVYTEMQQILSFRNSSVALRRGQPTSYTTTANNNVIAFTKTSGTEKVAVMVNVRNSPQTFTIPAGMAGTYTNPFTNAQVTLTSGAAQNLSAYQYVVLTNANVSPVAVTGVSVAPASLSLYAGVTSQLTASVLPANATNQNVTWSSSNSAVATVNSTGLLTAVAVGSATITVTTQDGNRMASCAVTVNPSTNFTVHFYRPASWGTGVRIYWWDAQPTGILANGSWPGVLMTNAGNGWYSHTFTNVASTNLIFNDGTNQTADLTRGTTGWYQNGVWYSSQPNTVPVSSISVSPASSALNVGSTQQLTATVLPSNASNKTVSWSSSNTTVATVSTSGLVTGVASGSANITVTSQDGGYTASSTITVTAPQTPYGGSAYAVPGTIQAENFDHGGQGVAYHDNEAANQGGQYRAAEGVDIEVCSEGGHNVGWTNAGEWLEYTVNVATTGNYNIALRAAGTGGSLHIQFNGVDKTGTITIPNTGGWQSWQTVTRTGVALTAGVQVMRIAMNTGGFNLNALTITAASAGTTAYRIRNRWQNTYLYDDGNQTRYGTPSATNTASHWVLEDVDGHKAIKNVGTGHYLNTETQQGFVECTAVPTSYWSAQWAIEDYDGHKRIRNRWQSGNYVHVENLPGYAQHGAISSGAWSGHWTLEVLSGSRLAEEVEALDPNGSEMRIYPNPFTSVIRISLPEIKEGMVGVDVMDLSGRKVLTSEMDHGGGPFEADLEVNQLPRGLYFLRVSHASGTEIFKLRKD